MGTQRRLLTERCDAHCLASTGSRTISHRKHIRVTRDLRREDADSGSSGIASGFMTLALTAQATVRSRFHVPIRNPDSSTRRPSRRNRSDAGVMGRHIHISGSRTVRKPIERRSNRAPRAYHMDTPTAKRTLSGIGTGATAEHAVPSGPSRISQRSQISSVFPTSQRSHLPE